MTHIDEAIRQAMSADDAAALERFGSEQPLVDQILGTLGGQYRWLNLAGWIAGFAIFAIGVACGWRFLTAVELREMMVWGAAAGLSALALALIKIWFWMVLQQNQTLREVKRLELQIARLAARERPSA